MVCDDDELETTNIHTDVPAKECVFKKCLEDIDLVSKWGLVILSKNRVLKYIYEILSKFCIFFIYYFFFKYWSLKLY